MLAPKVKSYYKSHYLTYLGKTQSHLVFGFYGIQAITGGHLSANQIEAARRVLSRYVKNIGKLWIRIFPAFAKTSKLNTRMGMGKGKVEAWYANVKANQILFEFSEIDPFLAKQATTILSSKLPLKIKLIKKT